MSDNHEQNIERIADLYSSHADAIDGMTVYVEHVGDGYYDVGVRVDSFTKPHPIQCVTMNFINDVLDTVIQNYVHNFWQAAAKFYSMGDE